jgi:hypothetical protein
MMRPYILVNAAQNILPEGLLFSGAIVTVMVILGIAAIALFKMHRKRKLS